MASLRTIYLADDRASCDYKTFNRLCGVLPLKVCLKALGVSSDPGRVLFLFLELDGADVSYEMRDGVPGLLCVKCDKHDWIPIRVLKSKYWKKFEQPEECLSDDSESGPEEEYSHEYLKNRKRLRYFKSKNGNPALSIATGRLKFPTPIAQRTRPKNPCDHLMLCV